MRRSVSLTLMAAFAAIYGVLNLVPAFKILGGSGFISASRFVSPVVGLILGPIMGAASVAMGGVLGIMVNPASATLGYFTFVPATACAFSSGMIRTGRSWIAASILGVLVVAFLAYPPNNVQPIFPFYVWIHLVAIFVLISPIRKQAVELARRQKVNEAFTGLALMIFPSTMIEQLTGSMIFALLAGPAISSIWMEIGMAVMMAFPIERALITVGASFIGAALIRSLRSADMDVTQ